MASEAAAISLFPSAPTTLEQSGLSGDLIQQLVLKTLYFGGELTGTELGRRLGLGFSVFEATVEFLKQQRLCEIAGGAGFGAAAVRHPLPQGGPPRAMPAPGPKQSRGIPPPPLPPAHPYMPC